LIYRDLIGIQLKEQYKLGILGFPSECQISNWRALGGTFQTGVRVSCSGGTMGGWKGHIPHTPVLFKMDRFSNSCKYYDNNVCAGGGSKQDPANNTHVCSGTRKISGNIKACKSSSASLVASNRNVYPLAMRPILLFYSV
jgi:hypothetical protein